MKVIYKITYPNGKIYVGSDLTNTLTNFGSVDNKLVEADFSGEEQENFTIRKQVLWRSEDASDEEVRQREVELISMYRSNEPEIGYNQRPRPKP